MSYVVQAKAVRLRVSPTKLRLVADMVRGLTITDTLNQLQFSKRRCARYVQACVLSAVANADHNHATDPEKLFVSEIFVDKSMVLRRFHARARGRGNRIEKSFSTLTVRLAKREVN